MFAEGSSVQREGVKVEKAGDVGCKGGMTRQNVVGGLPHRSRGASKQEKVVGGAGE